MYMCSYAGNEKPHSRGNILSGHLAAATELAKTYIIYVTTYAMSFLPNCIDQLSWRTSFLLMYSS